MENRQWSTDWNSENYHNRICANPTAGLDADDAGWLHHGHAQTESKVQWHGAEVPAGRAGFLGGAVVFGTARLDPDTAAGLVLCAEIGGRFTAELHAQRTGRLEYSHTFKREFEHVQYGRGRGEEWDFYRVDPAEEFPVLSRWDAGATMSEGVKKNFVKKKIFFHFFHFFSRIVRWKKRVPNALRIYPWVMGNFSRRAVNTGRNWCRDFSVDSGRWMDCVVGLIAGVLRLSVRWLWPRPGCSSRQRGKWVNNAVLMSTLGKTHRMVEVNDPAHFSTWEKIPTLRIRLQYKRIYAVQYVVCTVHTMYTGMRNISIFRISRRNLFQSPSHAHIYGHYQYPQA